MKGVSKGLPERLKECSPHSLYVHCHGHLLKLAIQDSMADNELLRNTLGTIQSLHNFLEGSPKRHAIFKDVELDTDQLALTLKYLSVTRWSCRWDAVKAAVYEQLYRIVKALFQLTESRDVKTSSESKALLIAVCNFDFALGLCVLKLILSNINSLSRYLQGKKIDVCTARRNAKLTIQTLHNCRNEENIFIKCGYLLYS